MLHRANNPTSSELMQSPCPYCRNYTITVTSPVPGLLTWLLCACPFMLGCFLACCVQSPMGVERSCPVCHHTLFHHRHL